MDIVYVAATVMSISSPLPTFNRIVAYKSQREPLRRAAFLLLDDLVYFNYAVFKVS